MLSMLNFVPSWIWAALVASLLATNCATSVRFDRERLAHQKTKTAEAERFGKLQAIAVEALELARSEEQRRAAEVQKVSADAEHAIAQARAAAVAAGDAGRRLRAEVTAAIAACGRPASSDPAVAGSGPPASTTADLLAELQQRLDDAADGIARFADEAHIAGLACQRSYQALTP